MHASIQATLYNAHFDTQGTPYTADDLMGRGDRQQRLKAARADKLALFKFTSLATSARMEDEIPEFVAELARNSKAAN